MSDSEEEFASADEGDSKEPATVKVEADKTDTTNESPKKEEPAQASGGKQSKKKGKGGKGGGGKQVKGDNSEVAQKPQQQQQTSAAGKGKKGKQKGKQAGAGPVSKKETDTNKDENVNAEKEETANIENSASPSKSTEVNTPEKTPEDSSAKVDDKSDTVSESPVKSEPEDSETVTGLKLEQVESVTDVKPADSEPVTDVKQDESKPVTDVKQDENESVKPEIAKADANKDVEKTSDVETLTKASDGGSDNLSIEEKVALLKSPSSQSIARPEPDHSEKEEDVLNKLASAATEKKKSGWGWGWGSSILEAASTSVTTFTSQVGEGFSTVLETVESTLNVPSPEDLVRQKKEEADSRTKETEADDVVKETKESSEGEVTKPADNADADKTEAENQSKVSQDEVKPLSDSDSATGQSGSQPSVQSSSDGWFSSWGVSNVAKMVESTSKNLVHGGLDALETLGKKTYDVITEHDPGFKKTRGYLADRGDKPNLSAMLRDAKEHDEAMARQEKENEEARKAHFGSLFDEFQGLAHLEALEILSNQSEKKVCSLLSALSQESIAAIKPELIDIKAIFDIDPDEDEHDVEDQDFRELVTDLLAKMNIGTTPDKIVKTQEKIRENLKTMEQEEESGSVKEPKEVHQAAIQSLAEMTSKSIEQFHKSGEMILLQISQQEDLIKTCQHLFSLTLVLCTEIEILSKRFNERLSKCSEGDDSNNVSTVATSIYLEASNSSSYIHDGFQLLLPVLQQASIEKSQEPAE